MQLPSFLLDQLGQLRVNRMNSALVSYKCSRSSFFALYPSFEDIIFFCWRLLGLIPGGAPFSQLNRGVKDAMAESTKLVECQFMTKTCKRPSLKRTRKKKQWRKPSTDWSRIAKGGLGWSHKDSTYAGATWNDIGRRWLWWNQKGSTYARASVQVASGGGYVGEQIYKVLAFNWVFLMKYWLVRS